MVNQQLLEAIGNDVVNEIVISLGESWKTGDLGNSISYRVENGKINIYMLPYWKYVEYGTPGTKQGQSSTVGGNTVSFSANPNRKMPLVKRGDSWINLVTDKEGDFSLAKHIQLYGTSPHPFLRPVMYHKLKDIVRKNLLRQRGVI